MGDPRYEGKPLLRLLELFVLDCIGEISDADSARLVEMAPKLSQTYNHTGTWQEIFAQEMGFPSTIGDALVRLWEKNQSIAREAGEELVAEDFAVMFVDANLAPG